MNTQMFDRIKFSVPPQHWSGFTIALGLGTQQTKSENPVRLFWDWNLN